MPARFGRARGAHPTPALLGAAPIVTVRLSESGSAKVGNAAPTFGGWDLAGRKVLTLDGIRRTPAIAPLLITFGVLGVAMGAGDDLRRS